MDDETSKKEINISKSLVGARLESLSRAKMISLSRRWKSVTAIDATFGRSNIQNSSRKIVKSNVEPRRRVFGQPSFERILSKKRENDTPRKPLRCTTTESIDSNLIL